MKTFTENLSRKLCTYDLSLLGDENDILFLDIETTGFAARSSVLYMIGCVYFEDGTPVLKQFFASKPDEEREVLIAFLKLCREKKILIHYNGNNFDIPYLKHKCSAYGFSQPFSDMKGIDIYKRIMPYKKLLGVEDLKQKTMERYLGIERNDAYNGGELINIYRDYVTSQVLEQKNRQLESEGAKTHSTAESLSDDFSAKEDTPAPEKLLLLHNCEDMKGMLSLLSLIAYTDIFLLPFKVTKVSAKKVTEPTGNVHNYLIIKLSLKSPLPKQITISKRGCRFNAFGNTGELEITMFSGQLKYYYGNYKEYYYLPEEDTALHKSVASFVSPDHRIQATRENCYTKKEGLFLPEWDLLFEPVFKTSYEDSLLYFEMNDSFKMDPANFHAYADHILDMLSHSKKRNA